MLDEHHIAFVEVRYRSASSFGDTKLSVTAAKKTWPGVVRKASCEPTRSGKATLAGLMLSLMMLTATCVSPFGLAGHSTQQPV